MATGANPRGGRTNGNVGSNPLASAEQTAIMVALVLMAGLIMVLVISAFLMFIELKTERDVNELLKQKILKRMIQCP